MLIKIFSVVVRGHHSRPCNSPNPGWSPVRLLY